MKRTMIVSLAAALLTPMHVAGPVGAAPAAQCVAEAANVSAALAMAQRCGTRVADLGSRSETEQVFVNPDGTSVVEIAAYPQRARKRDGLWSPLDATLQVNPDGSISPVATPLRMTLSAGGDTALLSSDRIALSWPGKLPKPVLDGPKATYAEVLPGVDLVVTALETGFSEVLVVRDRAAAKRLRQIDFGAWLGAGLRWDDSDGRLRAVDASGEVVLDSPAPLMWDSSRLPRGLAEDHRPSSLHGPGDGARRAPIGVKAADGRLTLTPDVSLLDDPGTRFPVYVDPTIGYTGWTMISSSFPNQSYWSYDKTDCPPEPGTGRDYQTECAKVGTYSVNYRSMFEFPTSAYQGKQILSARFTIDLLHSASCSNKVTELRGVSAQLGSGTTWNNTASVWGGIITTVSNSSCNQARKLTEFGVTGTIQAAETGDWPRTTFGLKADNEAVNQSTSSAWKKFDAKTAKLIVDTNTIPAAPSSVTVDNKACVAGSNRPFIKTDTPTVRAYFSDGDGNSMTGTVRYSRIKSDGGYSASEPISKGSLPSGTTQPISLPSGMTGGDSFVVAGDWDNDGHPDVVSKDVMGDLYLYPGSASKLSIERIKFGHGWGGYTVAAMADFDNDGKRDLIARENANGNLWLYLGTGNRTGPSGATRIQIGAGWNEYTIAGVTDWDRDGNQDIITTHTNGDLWLYPGEGQAAPSGQARVLIGAGWGGYTLFGTIDWDRDGAPDVIARDPSTGQLWLYMGSGTRGYYAGSPYRHEIGVGWGGYQAIVTPDFNGDGKADIIAKQPGLTDWFGYPGSGTRGYGGERWNIAGVGISQGDFAVKVSASDATATSGFSAWCEFTVDTVKPVVPAVGADIYTAGTEAKGAIGKTGRFTFSSSPDVTAYRWWWNGEPAQTVNATSLGAPVSIDWTPTSGGPKVLNVTAIDRAGNEETKSHQFVVAAESPAIAQWSLKDPAGSATVQDESGNNRHATINGAALGEPGRVVGGDTVVVFDGIDDVISHGDFFDSGKSFSVAMWARLDAKGTKNQSLIAQKGTYHPAFNLVWDKGFDRWAVQIPSNDNGSEPWPIWKGVVSTSVPQVGVWTHLAFAYDSANRELRLYVDGALEDIETGVVTWNANNPVKVADGGGYPFAGAASQLRVWDRVVYPREMAEVAAAANVGKWRFEWGYDPSVDESGFFHDLDYYNGAAIPQEGTSFDGSTALTLDGVDDYMATVDQVLHTDQSFTVSAWVKLASTNTHDMILSQDSDGDNAGIFLYYQNDNGGEWVFTIRDGKTGTAGTAAKAAVFNPTQWHQITGVFDAGSKRVRLYVDGVLKAATPMNAGWVPWQATGTFQIGRALNGGTHTSYFHGQIDEVRAYQGIGPVGGLLANWALNEAAGATTVADSSANNQTAKVYGGTMLGVAGRSGTAAQFDGTDDHLRAPSVVDTSQSFSAAAWVKLDSKGGSNKTVLSAAGTHLSSFYLQHNASSDRWALTTAVQDSTTPVWSGISGTSIPQTGVWTHLAATYDAEAKVMRLYVNGALEATKTNVTIWKASGDFRIGGVGGIMWHGSIDEVRVWNRTVSAAELLALQ